MYPAGVYGPPVGKRCVLFVDDLNLPQTDAFGTHPPLELLRQLVDHATWYDTRKEVEPIRLEDMQVRDQSSFVVWLNTISCNCIIRHRLTKSLLYFLF